MHLLLDHYTYRYLNMKIGIGDRPLITVYISKGVIKGILKSDST